jgi:hypothetical protein
LASRRLPGRIVRYCDRIQQDWRIYSVSKTYESSTQQQLCDRLNENRLALQTAEAALSSWRPASGLQRGLNFAGAANEHIISDIFVGFILPLCYGILGSGAAVVRSYWAKIRYSLLIPGDFTLSLVQLALGAVIGACIGLFVTPTGGSVGLTSTVTLSASALSFIAGFGAESVFVALESFIARVFNTGGTQKQ